MASLKQVFSVHVNFPAATLGTDSGSSGNTIALTTGLTKLPIVRLPYPSILQAVSVVRVGASTSTGCRVQVFSQGKAMHTALSATGVSFVRTTTINSSVVMVPQGSTYYAKITANDATAKAGFTVVIEVAIDQWYAAMAG